VALLVHSCHFFPKLVDLGSHRAPADHTPQKRALGYPGRGDEFDGPVISIPQKKRPLLLREFLFTNDARQN
jgi:hypothetical protein